MTFPIARDITLLAYWGKIRERYLIVPDKIVKEVNRRTVIAASRFVYSSGKSESFKNFVQKLQHSEPKWEVRTKDLSIEGGKKAIFATRSSIGYTKALRNLTL